MVTGYQKNTENEPLSSPPASLRVELVANPPIGDDPVERALSIRSRARVMTGVMVGLTALNASVAIAAPAVGPILVAAGLGSLAATRLKHGPETLTLYDSFLVWKHQRHELAGVSKVTVSLTSTWIWHGRHRCLAFEGNVRQIRWVARLLREVIRLGHLPAELTLPMARAK